MRQFTNIQTNKLLVETSLESNRLPRDIVEILSQIMMAYEFYLTLSIQSVIPEYIKWSWLDLGNKQWVFFYKDKNKDNIPVDNILGILLESIFRIFMDKYFLAIWEIYVGSEVFRLYMIDLWGSRFGTLYEYFVLVRPIVFCSHLFESFLFVISYSLISTF